MNSSRGFSLIEIIVAVAIVAILAGAVAPVVINQIEQARAKRVAADLQAIYEAAMGKPQENYFGYVGDVGELPDSVRQLMDGTGVGSAWNGPYLSLGGNFSATDIYGQKYVIDKNPIRVRSFGPNRGDDNGGGDDISHPPNPVGTFKGGLEVQVYINGRLIADANVEQVDAELTFNFAGEPSVMLLPFNATDMLFRIDSVHQGVHVLTVNARKAVYDPATVEKQLVNIYPGSKTTVAVYMQDADYMTRTDTDLNGDGIPDRLQDTDGDGIPDSMDPDIDGDGWPNEIDPDPYDPTVTGGTGGSGTAPMVTAVTPSFGSRGDSNRLITIDGAYFQSGATVVFSGTGITVLDVPAVFVGATQLTTRINIDGSAGTGYRSVTVTNPGGLSGSGVNIFEVLLAGGTPGPSISSITPNRVYQGTSNTLITINGQNLQSGTTIIFSNPGISQSNKTFISSSQINVTISVTAGASVGTGTLRVRNPDNKWDESAFTVDAVKPNISTINPNNANSGTNNRWVQITGSNFVSGFTASTSGTPLTINSTQFQSSTSIRVRVSTSFTLVSVDRLIIITNPGGSADSVSFRINGIF